MSDRPAPTPPPGDGPVVGAPRVALAIYAHPDDPEVAAGGTLARWASEGSAVHVCICAEGDKGTSDPAADLRRLVVRRREETEAAGRILGVVEHHWLGYSDGEVDDGPELRSRLVKVIRSVKPEIVLAPDPTAVFFGGAYVNHRDHRMTGWAVLDAVAPASASPHYFPDCGPPHRVEALYLSGTMEPDVWVDVSSSVDAKTAAIACHRSQLEDTGEWLGSVVRERAEEAGRQAGLPLAEGFRRILFR